MRFIVYGVGAIGGTIAAALALSGQEVAGIARGGMLDAIRERGLLLRTPNTATTARFPCHADPAEIAFAADDVILLTMKTQDTEAALLRLREAGVRDQPIVCMQNGVANERMALRLFPNVYAVTVMMPSAYFVPGEVAAFGVPKHGIFDLGRYPTGLNDRARDIAAALDRANLAVFPDADVMPGKYGKLILNLRNVLEAALGVDADSEPFFQLAQAEAETVYRAAGIAWSDLSKDPRRGEVMRPQKIDGLSRKGGSTTQGLARSSGSIETDYLNGEIVLLARLHGVPAPVNALLSGLGHRLITEGSKPGAVMPYALWSELRAAGIEA